MTRFSISIFAAVVLSACSVESLIDSGFPDRQRFAFQNSDKDQVFQYACVKFGDATTTLQNASQAHAYADQRISAIVDNAVSDTLAGKPSALIDAQIDQQSAAVVDDVEERFQCLIYEFRDT